MTPTQPKRGRPIVRNDALTQILSVRMTEREQQILRDYAWRYELSQSDVVRWSLEILGVLPQPNHTHIH